MGDVKSLERFDDVADLREGILQALDWASRSDVLKELEDELRVSEADIDKKINNKVLLGPKTVIAQVVGKLRMLAGQISGIFGRVVDLERSCNQCDNLLGMELPPTPTPTRHMGPQKNSSGAQGVTLSLGMTIVGDDGTPLITLGELLHQHQELQSQVAKLKSDVAAQGGVVFGEFSSPSEEDLTLRLTQGLPNPDCIAAFVDPISVFMHNKAAYLAEDKAIKDMLEDLHKEGMARSTGRKFVATFFRHHCAPYTSGGEVKVGKKIATLMSAGKWNGEDGLDGYSQHIKRDLEASESAAMTYIRDTVPDGPLNLLACRMLSRLVERHEKFICT